VTNRQGAVKNFGYMFIRHADSPRFSIEHPIHQQAYNPAPARVPLDSAGRFKAQNILYTPLVFRSKKIGGVTLGIFPQFMHVPGQIDPYPTEAFASAGFAVLFPMPRGGSGYGEAGHRMIINDWGGPDYKDIMAGVDHLIARGIADENRLGVMGASYGGYMTNWIVTQTSRFKAATAGAIQGRLVGPIRVSGSLVTDAWLGDPADPPVESARAFSLAVAVTVATAALASAVAVGYLAFAPRAFTSY